MMVSVYLSGPMTGIDDKNTPAFRKYTRELRDVGFAVTSPQEMDEEIPGFNRKSCMVRDFRAVLNCDWIALMPGWEQSAGCRAELEVALAAGKIVFYADEPKGVTPPWHTT